MSVSNLTNTTWVFKTTISIPSTTTYYYIDFTSNNYSWDNLGFYGNSFYYVSDYRKESEEVYPIDNEFAITWGAAAYKTISITGGTDVTNSTLISWLEANAHQITVTNLTNTTWEINTNFYIFKNQSGTFNINYNFGGIGYGSPHVEAVLTQLYLSGDGPSENPYYFAKVITGTCSAMNGQTNITPSDYASTVDGYVIDDGEYISNSVYIHTDYNAPWGDGWSLSGRTITILGGTDVTNTALINWLTDNATLSQLPTLATVEYDGETLTSIPANTTVTFNTAGKLLTSSITVTTGSGGSTPTLIGKSITVNGTYNASSDGADGYSQVTVAVPGPSYTTTSRASANHVLSGKYFYYPSSTSTVTRTQGTMGNYGTSDVASLTPGLDTSNNRVYFSPSLGGYYSAISRVYSDYSTLASVIGLTPGVIANGVVILGITGTYTGGGISDLTGTTWTINDDLSSSWGGEIGDFSISFTSNSTSFDYLRVFDSSAPYELIYVNTNEKNELAVYGPSGGPPTWRYTNYKTISITGGSDATNSTLISWLQVNATQVS